MSATTTKPYQAINFAEKLGMIGEQWSPRVVAELNDYQFKLARIEGDFIWHHHPETDEAFRAATPEALYKKWRTWQMSDHKPLWVEIETDFADHYLQEFAAPNG